MASKVPISMGQWVTYLGRLVVRHGDPMVIVVHPPKSDANPKSPIPETLV